MSSRMMFDVDDGLREQIDGLCENLNAKKTAAGRGRVLEILVENVKGSVEIKGRLESVLNEKDELEARIAELEEQVESIEEVSRERKEIIGVLKRLTVFLLGAKPN